ncbi:MAG: HNH endonuclease [Candidatus Krumholzibacteria bacterium]|nr:HNH endonuclease [Candidatus Krumholzibacteria bacterium]
MITSDGQAAGASGYLLHIHQCPECNRKVLHNSRGTFEVEPALLKAADCDAIVEREDGARRANISPRLRRLVLARDGYRCQGPGCGHTRFLEIHHRIPVALGGRTEMENLVTLCSGCHRGLHQREEELRAANRDPLG